MCNYSCDFCFHTTKNTFILPLEDAKTALRLLREAGMKKLNISGGEPFLNPKYIGEVFKFCKEELNLESTSIVCNGSKVTESWMEKYGSFLDVMAISCDSFDTETNEKQGRRENGDSGEHISKVQDAADLCKRYGIRVKLNSVITMQAIPCCRKALTLTNELFPVLFHRNNWKEDMNENIGEINPFRWKVSFLLMSYILTQLRKRSFKSCSSMAKTREWTLAPSAMLDTW